MLKDLINESIEVHLKIKNTLKQNLNVDFDELLKKIEDDNYLIENPYNEEDEAKLKKHLRNIISMTNDLTDIFYKLNCFNSILKDKNAKLDNIKNENLDSFNSFKMYVVDYLVKDETIKARIENFDFQFFGEKEKFEILNGLKRGLNDEQIKVVANNEFNDNQMQRIIDGFLEGLTIKEVMLYADCIYTFEQMNALKNSLLELDYDFVKNEIANYLYSPQIMESKMLKEKLNRKDPNWANEVKKYFEGII